jgi:hypothetical protein
MSEVLRKHEPVQSRLPVRTAGPLRVRPEGQSPSVGEAPRSVERRDIASRQRLLQRIGLEYQEMPGLSLTLAQARRLFDLNTEVCRRVLGELVDADVLRQTGDGLFVNNGVRP